MGSWLDASFARLEGDTAWPAAQRAWAASHRHEEEEQAGRRIAAHQSPLLSLTPQPLPPAVVCLWWCAAYKQRSSPVAARGSTGEAALKRVLFYLSDAPRVVRCETHSSSPKSHLCCRSHSQRNCCQFWGCCCWLLAALLSHRPLTQSQIAR